MRFTGTLKPWNDARGFGFIEPDQGGQALFVHISAFPPGPGRPSTGQRLTFEVDVGRDGKKSAKAVQYHVQHRRARSARGTSTAEWTYSKMMAIPMFLVLYAWVTVLWGFQPIVALCYVGGSILAILLYALDKAAAVRGRRRTPEATLHLVAVTGGWPGALLAQQLLRHKTAKREFVEVFWGTVLFNVVGLVFWHAGLAWWA